MGTQNQGILALPAPVGTLSDNSDGLGSAGPGDAAGPPSPTYHDPTLAAPFQADDAAESYMVAGFEGPGGLGGSDRADL